jgi:hypothetical protein
LIGTPLTKELNDAGVPIDSLIHSPGKRETTKRDPKRGRPTPLDAAKAHEFRVHFVQVQSEPPSAK